MHLYSEYYVDFLCSTVWAGLPHQGRQYLKPVHRELPNVTLDSGAPRDSNEVLREASTASRDSIYRIRRSAKLTTALRSLPNAETQTRLDHDLMASVLVMKALLLSDNHFWQMEGILRIHLVAGFFFTIDWAFQYVVKTFESRRRNGAIGPSRVTSPATPIRLTTYWNAQSIVKKNLHQVNPQNPFHCQNGCPKVRRASWPGPRPSMVVV